MDFFPFSLIFTVPVVIVEGILLCIFVYRRRKIHLRNQIQKIDTIEEKLPMHDIEETGLDTKCSICRVNFEPNQNIVSCPNCKDYFHLNHLQKWLYENFSCPMCKYDFEILFFDIEDREELETNNDKKNE
jgi:hypothetical protein